MHQWIGIVGLALDITGVLLIIQEWWISHRAAHKQNDVLRKINNFKEIFTDSVDVDSIKKYLQEIIFDQIELNKTSKMRPGLVKSGSLLIIIGFLLQIYGGWPRSNSLLERSADTSRIVTKDEK